VRDVSVELRNSCTDSRRPAAPSRGSPGRLPQNAEQCLVVPTACKWRPPASKARYVGGQDGRERHGAGTGVRGPVDRNHEHERPRRPFHRLGAFHSVSQRGTAWRRPARTPPRGGRAVVRGAGCRYPTAPLSGQPGRSGNGRVKELGGFSLAKAQEVPALGSCQPLGASPNVRRPADGVRLPPATKTRKRRTEPSIRRCLAAAPASALRSSTPELRRSRDNAQHSPRPEVAQGAFVGHVGQPGKDDPRPSFVNDDDRSFPVAEMPSLIATCCATPLRRSTASLPASAKKDRENDPAVALPAKVMTMSQGSSPAAGVRCWRLPCRLKYPRHRTRLGRLGPLLARSPVPRYADSPGRGWGV
jgi:hypothetical protein